MEPNRIATASIEDIIFEHRNKKYGAYDLRKTYEKRIRNAMIAALIIFVLGISMPMIVRYIKGITGADEVMKPKITEVDLMQPPPIDPNEPPPPPVEPPPPLKSTIKFLPPVVKPDEEVVEDPPTVEELEEADPGEKTQEGSDEGIDLSLLEGTGEDVIEEPEQVFYSVEQNPEFPGGEQALFDYISKNVKYPPMARENNIQGVVPVTFVVNSQGKVTNVKVARDIGGGCGEEAKRVVESMPTWKPGKQNGRPVSVHFSVQIRFFLK